MGIRKRGGTQDLLPDHAARFCRAEWGRKRKGKRKKRYEKRDLQLKRKGVEGKTSCVKRLTSRL